MNDTSYSSLSSLMQPIASEPLSSTLPYTYGFSTAEPSSSMDPSLCYFTPENPFLPNYPPPVSPSVPKDWLHLRPSSPPDFSSSTSHVLPVNNVPDNSQYTQDWYSHPSASPSSQWYPSNPKPSFSYYHPVGSFDNPTYPYYSLSYPSQVYQDLLSTNIHSEGRWNQDQMRSSDFSCSYQSGDESDFCTWPEVKHTNETQFGHLKHYGEQQTGNLMDHSLGLKEAYGYWQDFSTVGMDHPLLGYTCSNFKDFSPTCSQEDLEANAQVRSSSLLQTSAELLDSTFGETASCTVGLPVLPTNNSVSKPSNSGSDALSCSSALLGNPCDSENPIILFPSLLMDFPPINAQESKCEAQVAKGVNSLSWNMENTGSRHATMEVAGTKNQESSVICSRSSTFALDSPEILERGSGVLDSDTQPLSSVPSKSASQLGDLSSTVTDMASNETPCLLELDSPFERLGDSDGAYITLEVGGNACLTTKPDGLANSVENTSTAKKTEGLGDSVENVSAAKKTDGLVDSVENVLAASYVQCIPVVDILSSDCHLSTPSQVIPFSLTETAPVVSTTESNDFGLCQLFPFSSSETLPVASAARFIEESMGSDNIRTSQLLPFSFSETATVVSIECLEGSLGCDKLQSCFGNVDGSDGLYHRTNGTIKSFDLPGNVDEWHEKMIETIAIKSLNTTLSENVTNDGLGNSSDQVKMDIIKDSKNNLVNVFDKNGPASHQRDPIKYIEGSAGGFAASLLENMMPKDGASDFSKTVVHSGIDYPSLVQSMHNLSVLLLARCSSGSENLREPDLQSLQSVICNLSECLVKMMGHSTSTIGAALKPKEVCIGGDSGISQKVVEGESVDAQKQVPTHIRRSRVTEISNQSERRRRDRINEKMKSLRDLIPDCSKSDKASVLDDAIEYLKMLQLQVQVSTLDGCYCKDKDDVDFPVQEVKKIFHSTGKELAAEKSNPSQIFAEAVQSQKINSAQQGSKREKLFSQEQVKPCETSPFKLQNLSGGLRRDFRSELEERDIRILLYKNLWSEAEAALASLKFDIKYTKLELEMEKQKKYERDAPEFDSRDCKTPKSKAAVNFLSCPEVILNITGTGLDHAATVLSQEKSHGVPNVTRSLTSVMDDILQTDAKKVNWRQRDMLYSWGKGHGEFDSRSCLDAYDWHMLQPNAKTETEPTKELLANFGVLEECDLHSELKRTEATKTSSHSIDKSHVSSNDCTDVGAISDPSSHELNLYHRSNFTEGKGCGTKQSYLPDSTKASLNNFNKQYSYSLLSPDGEPFVNADCYADDCPYSIGRGRIPSKKQISDIGDCSLEGNQSESSQSVYSEHEVSNSIFKTDSSITNALTFSDYFEVRSGVSPPMGVPPNSLDDSMVNNSDMEREDNRDIINEHREFLFLASPTPWKLDSEESNFFMNTGNRTGNAVLQDGAKAEASNEYEIVTGLESVTVGTTAEENLSSESESSWEHIVKEKDNIC
eukprot:Gb_01625 [translate_table: standard]